MASNEQVPAGELRFEHLGRMIEVHNQRQGYAVQGPIASIEHIGTSARVDVEIALGDETSVQRFDPATPVTLLADPEF